MMKSFKTFLSEKILSIGLNPKHDHHREAHANEMHDLIRNSYAPIGGYGGHKSGSRSERASILKDIHNPEHIIKAVKRDGKISAMKLYKKSHGRKSVMGGADGSPRGKDDFKSIMKDDHKMKRAWAEVSGKVEGMAKKMGYPSIPSHRAKELTGKDDVAITSPTHYTRAIGGHRHEKTILGHPKNEKS